VGDPGLTPKPKVWKPIWLWYALIAGIARRVFFASKGGLSIVGKLNVPARGAAIIAPIHLSTLDPPAVASASRRHLRFMAKSELFKGIFGWGIRSTGAFPVRRGENDTEAIRNAIDILNDGQVLLLFPEGERGDGMRLGSINRGIAMLAKRTGAPIVPTAIVGTHAMLPRGGKGVKRGHVVVAFGQPFTYAEVARGSSSESRELFAAELEKRLLEICAENGLILEPCSASSAEPTE
jgi:1-acyl-sn-glycerol-3-phosphate acyltransferase